MSLSHAAKLVEFEQSGYKFSGDWLTMHLPVWERMIQFSYSRSMARVLEIGSLEGMSATWLIENKLRSGDEFYAVDSWESGNPKNLESVFDENVAIALERTPGVKFFKHKGRSDSILPELLNKGMAGTFDFIYVDGSHDATNVLEDLVFANLLCKVGGLILCDDYIWRQEWPIHKTPKLAVDAFTNCFREKIEIVRDVPLFQLWMRKLKD